MLFSERLNVVKGFEVWCIEVREKEGFDVAHTPLGIVSYLDSKGMLSPFKVKHNPNSEALELGTAAQQPLNAIVALAERYCDELKMDDIGVKYILSFARWARQQQ